jgi:thioesterase domain-containing protein
MRCLLSKGAKASGQTDVEELFEVSRLPNAFRKLLELHYQALRAYEPKAYAGRVTLFRARTRPLFRLHGRDLGWSAFATNGLDVVQIPGNHITMLQSPHVQVLAKRLMEKLQQAQLASANRSREPSGMAAAWTWDDG